MKKSWMLMRCSLATIAALTLLTSPYLAGAAEQKGVEKKPVVKENGVESKNEEWGKHYPRQYASWKETSKSEKIDDMLKKKPQLPILWAGYAFSKDYNAPRGHFYAVQDVINTLRTGAPVSPITGPLPTACWSCKSPDVPRLIAGGRGEGIFHRQMGEIRQRGGESHRLRRLSRQQDRRTRPHPPLSQTWSCRHGRRCRQAQQEDMRSLVCAQCHSEYYFKKTEETDAKGEKKVIHDRHLSLG